jgi:tRNA(Ile)-lysidine synthase
MDLLFNSVRDFCLRQGLDKTYWVGYSGGLDSHVLLHLLARLRSVHPIEICGVYINHGLSPYAAQWAAHCALVCRQLQIEFVERKIEIDPFSDSSPEEIAREYRYKVFAELLPDKGLLLTAHHQDDQAETLLVQLLRGAGPKGLAAMPRIKTFAKGFHARPLLDFTHSHLQDYAAQNQLSWVDDESNTDVNFVRNFLRHEILPTLKKRWPSVTKTLARAAENCAETYQFLDEVVMHDLLAAKGTVLNTLSIKTLLQFNPVRQRHVLRAWLDQFNFPIPPSVKLQQIQRDMLYAREDKAPYFTWHGIELRRYRDDFYAMTCLREHDSSQIWAWDFCQPLQLPNIGFLQAIPVQGQGMCAESENVTVRFRQGGEIVQLSGRTCHRSLKKLFQEWGVPPWERERVPLIFVGEKLAAVVGYGVSNEFAVQEGMQGIVLEMCVK